MLCLCGCEGEVIPKSKYYIPIYIHGHNMRRIDPKLTVCPRCNKSNKAIGKYHPWRFDENKNPVCMNCWWKIDPKGKERSRKNNVKRIRYRGQYIRVKENPRIGVCNLCRAVFPFDCSKTDMHHEKYYDDDKLKGAIEICNRCHMKQTWELKQMNKSKIRNQYSNSPMNERFLNSSLQIRPN